MRASFDGTGDVIVVTGGANGIGAALAVAAAGIGAKVVICDADAEAGAALAATHAGIEFVALDVGDRAAVAAAFAAIEARHGKVDGLVCAAAIQPRTQVHQMPPAEWSRVMAVNLDAVVWCYQAVVPGMIARRRGSIVAFTSGLALTGWPEASAYAASKAALTAFMRSAAKEVAQHRVRVNLIAPGVLDTRQYRQANPGADASHWARTTGVGQPRDAVGPLLFLLSDAATMTASLLSRDYAFHADE
jgi:3-oxoacyl-[acyl-carrier protein] reductase